MHQHPAAVGEAPPRHADADGGGLRFSPAALLRALVAAAGAAVGTLVAVPVGQVLFAVLFAHVGKAVMESVIGSVDLAGRPVIEAVILGIVLVLAGLVIAIFVVSILVAPVFVILPLAASGIALRLVRAGLVLRTVWLTLATAVILAVGIGVALEALELRTEGWVWLVIVASAAFVARIVVELWTPERARRPDGAVRSRWKRLAVVWVVLVVGAVVAAMALAVAGGPDVGVNLVPW